MNVTLSQLRAFERIVRLGSFHAAARDLHLTQPSVSQRIRELEVVLQTPLFVRRGPRRRTHATCVTKARGRNTQEEGITPHGRAHATFLRPERGRLLPVTASGLRR